MKDMKELLANLRKYSPLSGTSAFTYIEQYLAVEHDKDRYNFINAIKSGKLSVVTRMIDWYIDEFFSVTMADILKETREVVFELDEISYTFLGFSETGSPKFRKLGEMTIINLQFSLESEVRRIF
jgi:hypothetical protein